MKHFFAHTLFFIGALLLPLHCLHAAEIQFVTEQKFATVKEEIAVDLFLDTEGIGVNALSGNILVEGPVTISRIHDGDSVVGAWLAKGDTDQTSWHASDVTSGVVSTTPQEVRFSGIIPGGVTVAHGKILTLYVIPQKTGTLELSVSGTIFEDKSSGAPLVLRAGEVVLPIRSASPGSAATSVAVSDTTAPTIVRAFIAQNEAMFSGKPFIIVEAKDGESGVGDIELFESAIHYVTDSLLHDSSLPWRHIESPAALFSPPATSHIYLRVTDREGNSAVLEVGHPASPLSPEKFGYLFNKWLILAILIAVAGLFLWLWHRRRKHHA